YNEATIENSTVGGGGYNQAKGRNSTVAGGYNNEATGTDSTIAGGRKNQATGKGSFAAGIDNKANADNAVALGNKNTIEGENSVAIGSNNTVKKGQQNVFILGSNTDTTNAQNGSVLLGHNTAGKAATIVNSAEVGGLSLTGFAGASKTGNGTVSVGKKGKERQIVHVGAGEISDTSTDAVNGSQLHALATVVAQNKADIKDLDDEVGLLGEEINKHHHHH
uniref:UspA1 n=1 Tax=Moraxella catarrhalis TaxID=480 RepID=UPI0002177BC3|nr:Chain A, UspA1 [Moraxella catarrhalis]3NTN_B Chain B, UspA1 [Moraxella catarrhalis]3NTN_C Chain C, UspA1 [Moraxella catarrhalis]